MDVHHNLPKKPTSFSSDFALALSICLCFYFCNICIHVGIYCCLMSHISMITSEISHRFGRVQLMKSFIVVVFFVHFFSLSDLALPFSFFTHKIPGVFLIQCLHSDQQLRLARVRLHLLQKKKKHLHLCPFCSKLLRYHDNFFFSNRCN